MSVFLVRVRLPFAGAMSLLMPKFMLGKQLTNFIYFQEDPSIFNKLAA